MRDRPISHLTAAQMLAYRDRRLTPTELLDVSDHLMDCPECRSAAVDPVALAAAFERMQEAFPSHLTFDDLTGVADGAADRETTSRVEAHVADCETCGLELREYREISRRMHAPPELETGGIALSAAARQERQAADSRLRDFWHSLFEWRSIFATAAVALSVLMAVYLGRSRQDVAVAPAAPAAQVPLAPPQPAGELAVVRDGRLSYGISQDGRVVGMEDLPDQYRAAVGQALREKRVPIAVPEAGLSGTRSVLLGASDQTLRVALVEPVGVVVESDRPEFRWSPVENATYQVGVYDDQFSEIAKSSWLDVAAWSPARPLKRGQRYVWQLTVRRGGVETIFPAPPAPEVRFRVLSAAAEAQLNLLRTEWRDSHLLLAVAYSRVGLLKQATEELRALKKENPSASLVNELVDHMQAVPHKPE